MTSTFRQMAAPTVSLASQPKWHVIGKVHGIPWPRCYGDDPHPEVVRQQMAKPLDEVPQMFRCRRAGCVRHWPPPPRRSQDKHTE